MKIAITTVCAIALAGAASAGLDPAEHIEHPVFAVDDDSIDAAVGDDLALRLVRAEDPSRSDIAGHPVDSISGTGWRQSSTPTSFHDLGVTSQLSPLIMAQALWQLGAMNHCHAETRHGVDRARGSRRAREVAQPGLVEPGVGGGARRRARAASFFG